MNTHSIELDGYYARSRGNSTIYLGTAGSHGNEQLQVTQGKGWEGLTVQVVFHPCKVAVQLPANGVLDVPWEATARPLTALQGRIVFQGFDQDRLVNSTDLAYTVASHSPTLGRDEQPYTPGIVEGVLNQMAADKDAILQAAQQTGQAKEAAAASAAAAASSAANAQQSAGAANTSAGQAAASASQAAGSAAAANETLTQLQTAGQEAQQKVKDAETEALGNIAAAAPALPAVSAAAAWQSVTAKPDGTGYNLASMAPIEATIRPTVTGNPAVCKDSAAWGLQGLKIYGKSIQDGTPSPENPVPVVSAGEGGEIKIDVIGKNLFSTSEFAEAKTISGVTIQLLEDGGIRISGTPTASSGPLFTVYTGREMFLPAGKYHIDGTTYSVVRVKHVTGTFDYYRSTSFTLLDGESVETYIQAFASNYTPTTFYPILNFGENEIAFVPYVSQALAISTPNGLPGIPVESGGNFTDVDGQRWICDVKDYAAGKYTQNLKKILLDESQNWIKSSISSEGYSSFYVTLDVKIKSGSKLFCNRFEQGTYTDWATGAQKEFVEYPDAAESRNSIGVRLATSRIGTDDVDSFKTWLIQNPTEVFVCLDTAVTSDIPAEELAAYRALTTYDGTTVVSTAEPVAGIEASYVMDGNKYRESVDKRLAALEAAQTGI